MLLPILSAAYFFLLHFRLVGHVPVSYTHLNIQALLESQGAAFTDVVKTTCFLADMKDFAAFNEVYAKYFTGKPARSCVAVKELPKGVLCEVETIAAVKEA